MTTKGALIAAAVAGMFTTAVPVVVSAAGKGVKCDGGNACKGKSECHTAASSCHGTNACKGKGWITAKDEKECKEKGGKVGK